MPIDPTPPPRSAVAPMRDYEPPARPAMPGRPAPSPVSPPSVRPRRRHPPRTQPDRPARKTLPAPLQSAAIFADAALRRVLEVVDGRRPSTHLHPLLATGLADSVVSARPAAPAGRVEPATLQRVRVQLAGSAEPASAVEVFGTYRRGPRTHALACRVESVPGGSNRGNDGNNTAWRIVALHIG